MSLLLLLSGEAAGPQLAVQADFTGTGIKRPEYVYMALEELDNAPGTENNVESQAKWRTAKATAALNANSRSNEICALVGGTLYTWDSDGSSWNAYDSASDPSLGSDANYYWGVIHNRKLYLGDGVSEMVYDPRTATLSEWELSGEGDLPEKCSLAAVYRGRIVLARPADQPTNWYMSAVDDPGNWNFFPPTFTVDQAVFGNNAPAGLCPDIINTLIPYNDDYLIFGCDSSIWLLRGDPASGGEFDRISDSTGIAFGRSWCKDPTGIIYFFGSKGGVYRMAPGGLPQYLSDAREGQDVSIQSRLLDIDLSAYRVEMAWDFERQGLAVALIPISLEEASATVAYFWDSKNNAWWQDQPSNVAVQPYSVFVADGDAPSDRRVVYGCQDGFLREIDSDATSDDTYAINSHVTFGPMSVEEDQEVMLNRLKVILAKEQNGCTYEVYASDEPNSMGQLIAQGEVAPGQNPRLPVRKRGSFLWLVLRNTASSQRFAVEDVKADIVRMGRRKVRS